MRSTRHTTFPQILCATGNNVIAAGQTRFLMLFGADPINATENIMQSVMPRKGVLQGLRVSLTVAPGASETLIVNLRINGTPVMQAAVSGNGTFAKNESVRVPVQEGDLACYELIASASCQNTIPKPSIEYVA